MTIIDHPMLSWHRLTKLCATHGLRPVGGFVPTAQDDVPTGTRTIVLISPDDPVFWPLFSLSAEKNDGAADPLDRWSRRVIGTLACELGAKALFPFSGPPWPPFIAWAFRTGRVHASPVGLLIEDGAGLFFSVRGALAVKSELDLPGATASPCETCADRPCLDACPVGALGQGEYDTDACQRFIATDQGSACIDQGCAVRRACPISPRARRLDAQSAFHMRAFQR